MSSQILFICTGNFYRSRFAEAYFNHHATERNTDWHAISRGLATHLVEGCGPISVHTVGALESLKIEVAKDRRSPVQLSRNDLEGAKRVIAMKEPEHRPMMEEQFPEWADRVEYWNVHDLDMARPDEALAELRGLVQGLVDEIDGMVGATA